jgi:hypothetical protein
MVPSSTAFVRFVGRAPCGGVCSVAEMGGGRGAGILKVSTRPGSGAGDGVGAGVTPGLGVAGVGADRERVMTEADTVALPLVRSCCSAGRPRGLVGMEGVGVGSFGVGSVEVGSMGVGGGLNFFSALASGCFHAAG